MKHESYTVLLGRLGDELKEWADFLPEIDSIGIPRFESSLDERLYPVRRSVMVRLGADRRASLGELIDDHLNQVKQKGLAFAAACAGEKRSDGSGIFKSPWKGAWSMRRMFADRDLAKGVRSAAFGIFTALHNCDELFYLIDREIRQIDFPGSEDDDSYKSRFGPGGYLPDEICKELDISTATLNKYAKAIGVDTPAKGQRNFRYRVFDRELICRHIIAAVSDTDTVEAARQIVTDIESKSNNKK
jgi:hypothetical protein